jgi:hypothetical protein
MVKPRSTDLAVSPDTYVSTTCTKFHYNTYIDILHIIPIQYTIQYVLRTKIIALLPLNMLSTVYIYVTE